MSIISVWNRKGGVGKTTSVINLAGIFSEFFKKNVLCIDADSQINLTQFFYGSDSDIFDQGEMREEVPTIFTLAAGRESVEESLYAKNYVITRRIKNKKTEVRFSFDVLLGDRNFDTIDKYGKLRLKKAVSILKNAYDIILIDFPPTSSDLTSFLLSQSDYLIVPMIPAKTFSIAGLEDVFSKVELVRGQYPNSEVSILGSFYTNVQIYKKDQKEFIEESRKEEISDSLKLFNSYITYDYASAQRSDEYNIPINLSSHNSKMEQDYISLAKEILDRIGE